MRLREIATKKPLRRKLAPPKDSVPDRPRGIVVAVDPGKIRAPARDGAQEIAILPPIAGGIFGHYIDVYFNTEPWFTGILAFAGFIHSIVTVIRIAREVPPTSQG